MARQGFVDMFTLRRESGTERADERFREIVLSHLARTNEIPSEPASGG